MRIVTRDKKAGDISAFLAAVHDRRPVGGFTHNFYRYPARFSPLFARAAIEAFSRQGDVILDPFMGGATTLVEARALGRHAIGCDVSSLSTFLAQVKTTALSERELEDIEAWVRDLPKHLNLHRRPNRAVDWLQAGYQRNLPWPIRKSVELALARLPKLSFGRQQRFARCLLLRTGQWALDCREHIPSAPEFRDKLFEFLEVFIAGMREYRQAIKVNPPPNRSKALTIAIHGSAAALTATGSIATLPSKPRLVVTSPPYPGVYVLYHRWKVRGRKESPAPFWVADCLDGQGQAHYCFGHRKQRGLASYFEGIRSSYASVRDVIHPSALVIQMVAFAEPEWQVPRFMASMSSAGFAEVLPHEIGVTNTERLWRIVPGRRWFAMIHGALATSKELVLFHRPA